MGFGIQPRRRWVLEYSLEDVMREMDAEAGGGDGDVAVSPR